MKRPAGDKGKILIITLTGDVHLPFVTKHLSSDFIVVDPYRILEKCELSYAFDGKKTVPIFDGIPLENIKSVWYRKPYIPEREDICVPEAYKDYSCSAIRKHAHDLYGLFTDAFWLTNYYTILKQETKPRQLEQAAKLGFNVPKTLTTTSAKAAAAFLENAGAAVAKSMATTLPIVDNKVQYFYTTKITPGQQIDFSGLHVAPSIFQQAIDTVLDLRVTVVGDQVFAASIKHLGEKDHPDIRDWRRAYTSGELRCEEYALPAPLRKKCVALAQNLGLSYGAIDLVVDTEGNYWFLEINPNGQWAFAEEDTGMPIGKAIADLLESAGKS